MKQSETIEYICETIEYYNQPSTLCLSTIKYWGNIIYSGIVVFCG